MNSFPDDVRCNVEIYRDDILYYKCKQASNLWRQLEFVSECESDLRDTVDRGRKRLVDFNFQKKYP